MPTCNFPPGDLELVECLHVLVHVLGHYPAGLPMALQDAHTPRHALLSEGAASHLMVVGSFEKFIKSVSVISLVYWLKEKVVINRKLA